MPIDISTFLRVIVNLILYEREYVRKPAIQNISAQIIAIFVLCDAVTNKHGMIVIMHRTLLISLCVISQLNPPKIGAEYVNTKSSCVLLE